MNAIVRSISNREANRKAMPKANFTAQLRPRDISGVIFEDGEKSTCSPSEATGPWVSTTLDLLVDDERPVYVEKSESERQSSRAGEILDKGDILP